MALAAKGASEGIWLRAERQTGGRGRQGRVWESPPGNCYASTLVRLRSGDPAAPTLALVIAVAAHAAVRDSMPGLNDLRIKWPNDLLVGGRKLSGMLLEREGDAVVIGVGVNLAHHPEGLDRAATSLAAHGPAPDPAIFLAVLAERFAAWRDRWRSEGLAPIRAEWLARAHPPGTGLTARRADGSALDGSFDGLTEDGALCLRLPDGSRQVVHAGDVFLI